VLVTGAASGIGRAIASRAHAEGADLLAVDVDHTGLESLGGELGAERFTVRQLDLADAAAVDAAAADLGPVDVLVNNAGISDQFTPGAETTDELWDRVLGVNLFAAFRLSRSLLPGMVERGGGAIVNTASVAAISGGAGGAAYTVSKHGLLGLTRSLATDYGPKGVRVNAVLPGAIKTAMTSSEDALVDGVDEAIEATTAGRWAEPEEVANVVLFLASEEASFIHGSAYKVDGGWTLV
jgi:NAD(P)-dependent dehydrogenase (short-subunit alcohol dehydrogenase family)